MMFEPACLHQHVLNFYRSTGSLGSSPDWVSMTLRGPHRVSGSGQHFEQSLYFLLGHLLPDYAPLHGEMLISASRLQLWYSLPARSELIATVLGQALAEDNRFQHLLEIARASCQVCNPDDRHTSIRVELGFPLQTMHACHDTPILDLAGLEERFGCSDMAQQMLELFVANARLNVSSLRDSIRLMNWSEAHRLAHTLKGGALNLGAGMFARAAKDMELAIKEHRHQALPVILERLETACQELESAWQNQHGVLYG